MRSRVYLSLFVAVLAFARAAGATPPAGETPPKPEIDAARQAYADGVAAYRIGHYDESAKRFEAAYRVTKFPSMLFDIAQSYRRLYETTKNVEALSRSIDLYRAFLRDAPPAADRRPIAEKLIPELEQQLASESRRRREEMLSKATGKEALFVAEQLMGEGAPKDAATVLDRLLASGGNSREVLVAALEKRGLVAAGLRDPKTAENCFQRALALSPGLQLTDDVDERAKSAFAAAKRSLQGKAPVRISHVPIGQAPRNSAVTIPIVVESDPLSMVAEIAVAYRLSGAGAYSMSRAAPESRKVEISGAFIGTAGGGARVEYYVLARDVMGNELVTLGSAKTPLIFSIERAPGEAPPIAAVSSEPWYRKWWVWTIIGSVAVAGGTGAYMATRSDPYNPLAIQLPPP